MVYIAKPPAGTLLIIGCASFGEEKVLALMATNVSLSFTPATSATPPETTSVTRSRLVWVPICRHAHWSFPVVSKIMNRRKLWKHNKNTSTAKTVKNMRMFSGFIRSKILRIENGNNRRKMDAESSVHYILQRNR